MSAEILRRAASLMRERAEAAPEQTRTDADVVGVWLNSRYHLTIPPAVALAVADWLDHEAQIADEDAADGYVMGPRYPGLILACAYLGESA
jgi:hypothetical protein